MKANKDARKRLNGSTELKRTLSVAMGAREMFFGRCVTFDDITEHNEIEESLARLFKEGSQRLWQAGPTFIFSFRLELHKEPWRW